MDAIEQFHLCSVKVFKEALINVIPAKAGIHNVLISLDPRLRGGDEAGIDQRLLKLDSNCKRLHDY